MEDFPTIAFRAVSRDAGQGAGLGKSVVAHRRGGKGSGIRTAGVLARKDVLFRDGGWFLSSLEQEGKQEMDSRQGACASSLVLFVLEASKLGC